MALFGDYTWIDTTETQISCNWQCMDWNILFFIAKTKCNYAITIHAIVMLCYARITIYYIYHNKKI